MLDTTNPVVLIQEDLTQQRCDHATRRVNEVFQDLRRKAALWEPRPMPVRTPKHQVAL